LKDIQRGFPLLWRIWTATIITGLTVKRLILPGFLILLVLTVAAAITYAVGQQLGMQIYCVNISGVGPGCRTNWGMTLALLWGIVAVGIGLIWRRFRDG
jgi:hypothetical protein